MKLIHTADLHLGRQFYGFNIIPDQEHILKQIVEIAISENVDGVIIAGDIYDTQVAGRAAVDLLNTFLTTLSNHNISVFIVSGNHDSPERIHFGSHLMDKSGVYIGGVYDETRDVRVVTLSDEYGTLHICLLPYLDPSTVRSSGKFESQITTFDEAVREVIGTIPMVHNERFVLVAHQFFSGTNVTPMSSESERLIVGGIESVNIDCLSNFDYVALGHLHTPQKVGDVTIRYSGSPLKYSPSESSRQKSVTVIEFFEKGNVKISERVLTPLKDLRTLTGTFAELLNTVHKTDDYLVIQLTDRIQPHDAMQQLRKVYPNLIRLDFLYEFSKTQGVIGVRLEDLQKKSDLELFSEFFTEMSGREMTEFQERSVLDILEKISGEKR